MRQKVIRHFKYRLFPNKTQEKFLKLNFGAYRFVYNKILNLATRAYYQKNISWNMNLYVKYLKLLKKQYVFLNDAIAAVLITAIRDLDKIFKQFFKKNSPYPKYKRKKEKQSITLFQRFKIIDNKVKISKLDTLLKFKKHRPTYGKFKSIKIIYEYSKWYIVIYTEYSMNDSNIDLRKLDYNKIIALDLGLKHFYTDSRGNKIDNLKFLIKEIKKIKKEYKKLKRKQKNSNRYLKQLNKIRKLYHKIVNKREDFLHKLSSKIVNENQVIILEDLDIKHMSKNKLLSKHIYDVSWRSFINKLEYKSKLYNKILIKINKYFPSSKLCFVCGHKNKTLKLSDRHWVCPVCNTTHDRDFNAALNILFEGLKILYTAGGVGIYAQGDIYTNIDELRSAIIAHHTNSPLFLNIFNPGV